MSNLAGIDLGTERTKIARLDLAGNPVMVSTPDGELWMRSAVAFTDHGLVVGSEAAHLAVADPSRCVLNPKRDLGTDKVLGRIDDKEYRAVDVVQVLLKSALEAVEPKLDAWPDVVVITVPANFEDHKKDQVKAAAAAAGLNQVHLAHEPRAALFGARAHEHGDGYYLIIDVGGGTTDISLASVSGHRVDVIATDGISRLGGLDFTARIEQHALAEYRRQFNSDPPDDPTFRQDLRERCEARKVALSSKPRTHLVAAAGPNVLRCELTREQYQGLTEDLVEQVRDLAIRTLKEAGVTPDKLRAILLVGGQSEDPAFAAMVKQAFGREPWPHGEPHLAVPLGSVVLGRIELERQGRTVTVGRVSLPPIGITSRDVTMHPIGLAVLDERKQLVHAVMLQKGTPIPSQQVRRFQLAEPDQRDAKITVLQGPDGVPAEQCSQLGVFEMTDLKPVRDRPHPMKSPSSWMPTAC